jgi:peptidoglycan/LPS O-acetylase OafA/YrhL
MFSSNTFKSILDKHRGVGPGFDLLRVVLAIAIFYTHANWAAGHGGGEIFVTLNAHNHVAPHSWEGWRRPLLTSYVPAFFALSGFLVTGSALRTKVVSTFLAFRGLRIFPALTIEVALSALLLGAATTNLPLAKYFSNPDFFRYFGNIFGWITFTLPGVFINNPAQGVVNASLWTLPSEFDCYFITAILMATGLIYRRIAISLVFLSLTAILVPMNLFTNFSVVPTKLPGYAITYYFFMGVMFYHWREFIPKSWLIFGISAVASYGLQYSHHAVFLAPIFVTYFTLFFGLLEIPKIPILSSGDYSYGIYLYGFPITQAVVFLVPGARGNNWMTLVLSLILTCGFAAFSWHMIEKPTLTLKRRLPKSYFPSVSAAIPIEPSDRETAAA